MRQSVIMHGPYLGSFYHLDRLNIGNFQSMQFETEDIGLFYLSPKEIENRKFVLSKQLSDLINEKTKRQTKTKKILKDLQAHVQNLNIPISYDKNKFTKDFVSKLKDMLQILWKREGVDEAKLDEYTMSEIKIRKVK